MFHALFFFSGFTALGLQLVWTRMFSIGIGHELFSVLAVISAFFGGLSLGALALEGPIARSRKPGRVYAALEAIIGAWGLASLWVVPWANRMIFALVGWEASGWRHALASFALCGAALLPATFCMGATLPAIERLTGWRTGKMRTLPGLYAANTAGAVLGVLVTVFWLTPRFGYAASLAVFAAIALVNALAALALSGVRAASQPDKRLAAPGLGGLWPSLFMTGFLGIGYEVVCTRALSQFFEDSVFTYAILLLIYLLGTALGAWIYHMGLARLASRHDVTWVTVCLFSALGIACLIGAAFIPAAGPVSETLARALGRGPWAQSVGELGASVLVFLLPTLVMGATFSHLAQAAKETALGVGRALAINTLGGALAPLFFGVLLVPAVGMRNSLVGLGLGYGLLIRPWRMQAKALSALGLAMAMPLAAVLVVPWSLVTVPEGFRLLRYEEGAVSSVAVLENQNGQRNLKTDNRFYQGGTVSLATERLKSHLPLLLHPNPRRALWIGMGTGVTFGAAADYPGLEADAVELDPGVVAMQPLFAPQNRYPYRAGLTVHTADARRFVRTVPVTYDVVVADFFQPNRDGAAALYTFEHFESIRARLRPDGLFCQWLPLYQLDEASLRIIVKTFLAVFPQAQAFLGNFNADLPGLALMGGPGLERTPFHAADAFERRVADRDLKERLAGEALTDGYKLAAFYLASARELALFAEAAPLNTDDHPRVMYLNPGFSLRRDYTTYGRLESLVGRFSQDPEDWAGPARDSAALGHRDRLAGVFAARNLFLHGILAEAKGRNEEALALFLRSAEASPHFTVGYAKCLVAAMARVRENPDWSRGLLRRLVELRPEIDDARTVLREDFGE